MSRRSTFSCASRFTSRAWRSTNCWLTSCPVTLSAVTWTWAMPSMASIARLNARAGTRIVIRPLWIFDPLVELCVS